MSHCGNRKCHTLKLLVEAVGPRPPGVGKTHLAINLTIAAAKSGRRVYYGTRAGLFDSLVDA